MIIYVSFCTTCGKCGMWDITSENENGLTPNPDPGEELKE
jgi:hypothetical protein